MAKGGSILTTGFSGKFGNAVFRVKAGSQELSAYQPRVKNPRSYGQQTQRARFANAVKFYKQALGGFFKFAYEDKRANESDFNAFMRHNSQNFSVLTKAMIDSGTFPCVGSDIQLAQGSLQRNVELILNTTEQGLEVGHINGQGATVGEVSTSMISQYGFAEGDIVTLIVYYSDASRLATSGWASVENPEPCGWSVAQFIVNEGDTTPIGDISQRGNARMTITGDNSLEWGIGREVAADELAIAYGAVVTRVVSSGLKANNSILLGNETWESMVRSASSAAWVRRVADSWGASEEAVLQGGIAGPTTISTSPAVVSVNGATPPAEVQAPSSSSTLLTVQVAGRNLGEVSMSDVAGTNVSVSSVVVNSEKSLTISYYVVSISADFSLTLLGQTIVKGSGEVIP